MSSTHSLSGCITPFKQRGNYIWYWTSYVGGISSHVCQKRSVWTMKVKSVRKKTANFCVWPFYNHFRPFLCIQHLCLSQNLDADNHFEGLNVYESQLDQNWHKLQILFTSLFFNIRRKKMEIYVSKMAIFWPFVVIFTATT